jgi:sulfur carrier protein
MLVNLNGRETAVSDGSTVADLLATLADRGRLAVEVNGGIVPRSEHDRHVLAEGDRIEIVRAIGGG